MYIHADKKQKTKRQSAANIQQSHGETSFQLVNNRPEAAIQRKLQATAAPPIQLQKIGIPAHSQQSSKKYGPSDEFKVDTENEWGHGVRPVVVIETSEYPHMTQSAISDWIDHMGTDPDKIVNISQSWDSHVGPAATKIAALPRNIRAYIHPGDRMMTVEGPTNKEGRHIASINRRLNGMIESDVQHIASHPGTGQLGAAHGHIYLPNGGDAGIKAAAAILAPKKKKQSTDAMASDLGVPQPLDTSGTSDVDDWED